MRKTILVTILGSLLFLAGCTDKELQAGAKASAGVAAGLQTMQAEVEVLCGPIVNGQCTGKLATDEAKAISTSVNTGLAANAAFRDCVRGAKNDKQAILACFGGFVASLDQVEASTLYVKNPDSQIALRLAFASVKSALVSIKALMPQGGQ